MRRFVDNPDGKIPTTKRSAISMDRPVMPEDGTKGSAETRTTMPTDREEFPMAIPRYIPRDRLADGAAIPPDSTSNTRWLSYRELAEVLAPMKLESAIRLVRRKRWVKRESNSGIRVAVPADVLADMLAKRPSAQPTKVRGDIREGIRAVKPPDIPPDDKSLPIIIRKNQDHAVAALEAAVTAMGEQLVAIRADQEQARADWADQIAVVRADLERARADAADQRVWSDGLDAENRELRSRADRAEAKMEAASVQLDQLRCVLREAEAALTVERGAKATAEAMEAQLRGMLDQARAEAGKAAQLAETEPRAADQARADAAAAAEAETVRLREALAQARAEAAEATQAAAEAEATRLRQTAELATVKAELQETEALRAVEIARAATRAAEAADRPTMVASKIDEVQLRRLQAAEQARKSLGRLARLRAAWRGE
jgi:hypothetical protein